MVVLTYGLDVKQYDDLRKKYGADAEIVPCDGQWTDLLAMNSDVIAINRTNTPAEAVEAVIEYRDEVGVEDSPEICFLG